MGRRISPKFIIAVTLLVGGLAILFGVGLKGSLVYYLTVSEFLDGDGSRDLGDHFRINGHVVPGSIEKKPSGLGARFVMSDGQKDLAVVYSKETPDTFVDGSEVVVEGSLGQDGVFVAHTLLAKCPSKYESGNTEEDYKQSAESSAVSGSSDPGPSSR